MAEELGKAAAAGPEKRGSQAVDEVNLDVRT